MSQIEPADDEYIASLEECLDGRTVWDDEHIARLIARIRQADEWHGYIRDALGLSDNEPMRFDYYAEKIEALRENTIRECADAANEAWLDGTPISMMRMSILALSKRSQS